MRVPSFVVWLVVSLVGASGHAHASEFWDEVKTPGLREWRQHVADARAALSAGRFDDALHEADQAVARLPERAEGQVVRARALGELSQMEAAVAGFERALELDPSSLDRVEDGAHAAQIVAGAGSYVLAARILPRVLGRMNDNAHRGDLYALHGDVSMSLGPDRLRDAVLAYREAARGSGRNNRRVSLGLALALARQGEWFEAHDLARDAAAGGALDGVLAALPIPEPERAARRALVLEATGDRSSADAAWREAATDSPWQAFAQSRIGVVGRGATR
jgi:tetratricopeptide (TPR) repeat protein